MFRDLKKRLADVGALKSPAGSPAPAAGNGEEAQGNGKHAPASPAPASPATAAASPSPARSVSPSPSAATAEEINRLQGMSHGDLVLLARKNSGQLKRYKVKMGDVVAAYKEQSQLRAKLEGTLERQQDSAAKRIREVAESHKLDTAAKDKLVAVLRARVQDRETEVVRLKDRVTLAEQAALTKASSLEGLASEQESALRVRGSLEKQIRALKDEVARYTETLAEKDVVIAQLRNQVAAADKAVIEGRTRVEEKTLSLKQKDIDLLAQAELIASLRAEGQSGQESSEETVAMLRRQGTKTADTIEAQQARIADLEAELEMLRGTVKASSDVGSTAETQARDAQEALDTALGRLSALESDLRASRAQAVSSARTVAELELEVRSKTREAQHAAEMLDDERRHAHALAGEAPQADEMASLQAELRGAKQALRDQVEALTGRLEKQGADHAARVAELDAAKADLSRSLHNTEQENSTVKTLVDSLREQLATLEQSAASARSTLEAEARLRTSAEASLADSRQDLGARTAELEESRRALADRERSLARKKEQAIELGARIKSIQTELDARDASLAALEARRSAATAEAEAMSARAASLEQGLADARTSASDERQAVLAAKDATLETTREELRGSRDELRVAQEALHEHVAQLSEQASAVDRLEATSAEQLQSLAQLGAQLTEAKAALEDLSSDKSARIAKEARLKAKVATLEADNEQLQAAELLSQKLQADLSSANEDRTRSAQETTEELERLQARLSTANQQRDEHEIALLSQREQTSALTSQLAESNARVQDKKASLEQARATVMTRDEEITALCSSLEDVKDGLREANEKLEASAATAAELAEIKALCGDLEARLDAVTAERDSTLEQLEAAQLEYQKATKLQQQHATELKRTLQKQLRRSESEELPPISALSSNGGLPDPPRTLDIKPRGGGALPTSGPPGEEPPFNLLYGKHVMLKYMTSGRNESKYLLKVLSTLFKFTKQEEARVQKHLAAQDSWW